MSVDQILQQKIKDTQVWLSRENEESIYKRDLKRRDRIDKLGFGKYEKFRH